MAVDRLITTVFRRKLRRRAAICLSMALICASANFAAVSSRSYHYGLVKDPFLSPIAFDVSLDKIAVKSECIHWVQLKRKNIADEYCKQIVGKLDNLSLHEAASRVCNLTEYLNLASGGVVCSTLSALALAGSFVYMILWITLVCDFLIVGISLVILCAATDPFASESVRSLKNNPANAFLGDQLDPEEAERLESLREIFDAQSLRLAILRSTVRVSTSLAFILSIWAPLIYPLLGENIHMNSMPLFHLWPAFNPSLEGTSLSVGYVILCLAVVFRFLATIIILMSFDPKLTQPLALIKLDVAHTRAGRVAQYDGFDDVIGFNGPLTAGRPRTVTLNDHVVDGEVSRLMNSNISSAYVAGADYDDW